MVEGLLKSHPAEAYLRKNNKKEDPILNHGALTFNLSTRQVTMLRDDRKFTLTRTEARLFVRFMKNVNAVLEIQELNVWDKNTEINLNESVKHFVMKLRRKLEPDKSGDNYEIIVSIHGVGYMLKAPVAHVGKAPSAS